MLNVGIIGCGNISGIYFKNGSRFGNYHIIAAADIDPARADAKVSEIATHMDEWKLDCVPEAQSVAALLANPNIELVLNLTVPKAHAQVTLDALAAGKHVYCEKPLAASREDGRKIMELAARKNLRVGCAPDTFLGGGHQTCRKIIDDGIIGSPVAATAFMTCAGHERWHPNPDFYYQLGGGPMFDMAPYYLTALINMMGPIKRVCGMAKITYPERVISSQPRLGQRIKVETPTHISTTLEFAGGAITTMIMSFDIWHAGLPFIEVYGTKGSLSVSDPNTFGGPIKVRTSSDTAWNEAPINFGFQDNSRGIGVADMVSGIRQNRPHRASGELAFHVLDVMAAGLEAATDGKTIELKTTCQRPETLVAGAQI